MYYASHTTSTTPFKAVYMAMVSVMALFIISGSFFMQSDPRFKLPALIAGAKHLMYASSFMASEALAISGLDRAPEESGVTTGSVPVLIYHGVLTKPDNSKINLTEEQFRDHMFALKRAGYNTITLEQLYLFSVEGAPLPEKPILITFDDGRADSFYNGDPILDAVDYNAVMFPITKYVVAAETGGYYLSRDELQLMQRSGRWEIGSHSDQGHEQYALDENGTMGNFYSNHLWLKDEERAETAEEFRDRIKNDLSISRQYFEELTGSAIHSFAFPFGDLGQNQKDAREKTRDIIAEASSVYRLLFYQYRPGEYFTQFSPGENASSTLLIRRIDMSNTWDAEEFLDILKDGQAKSLPFTDTFDTDKGWINVWGEHKIENGTLSMQASPLQTGASTIIDGSANWTDYIVRAEMESPERTGVFIWTRFIDDNNNAACNFGADFVHAEQMLDGEKNVLKGIQRPNSIPAGPFTVSARVEGRTLICSINDVEILRTEFLDPSISHGGTGVKIWDESFGKSSVIIEQLTVESIKSEE